MRTTTSRIARAQIAAALLPGLLLASPSSAQDAGAQDDPPAPPVVENTSAMDPEVVALLEQRVAAVAAAPGEARAWEDLGLAYEANTIWSLAEKAYSGLLDINGGDAQWLYRRGVVRFKIGDLEGALADLASAANTYKNTPVVQAWHADLLRMMGELEAAEAGWRQAIQAEEKQDPRIEWPQSRVGLAMTLLDLERPAEAEELCRRALELNPGYAHAAFILGRALRDLDRSEEAEVAFARAGDAFPSFPPDPHQTRLDDAARGFSRRMMVIENLIQAQNLPEAKRRIAAVLQEFPERHQVINTAARLALREGDVIRARELLGQSLTLAPQDPSTLLEACLLELTEADSFSQQMMRLQQMAAAGQKINPDQLEQLRSKARTPAEKAVEYATSAAQAAPLVGRYSFWLGMSQRSLAQLSTDGQAQQQLLQQAMASMQRASRLGCTEPSFHQQIASMYATVGPRPDDAAARPGAPEAQPDRSGGAAVHDPGALHQSAERRGQAPRGAAREPGRRAGRPRCAAVHHPGLPHGRGPRRRRAGPRTVRERGRREPLRRAVRGRGAPAHPDPARERRARGAGGAPAGGGAGGGGR